MAAPRSGRTPLIEFGDGEYEFFLGIGQLRELQEKCGECGPPVILQRLSSNAWRVDDVYETIRLGLVGGGTKPVIAKRVADRYAGPGTYLESVPMAQAILLYAITGGNHDPVGKQEAAKAALTGSSTSPPSTD